MNKNTFIYLVQTCGAVTGDIGWMRSKEKIVLSYENNTPDTNIFAPNTTWTQGRNLLFNKAIEKDFDYYVFVDHDLAINEEGVARFENTINNLQRNYPIVTPRAWDYNRGRGFFDANMDMKYKQKGLENLDWECQTVDWFDGCFNAFHKSSIKKLLPYIDIYDDESWWYSQLLLIYKSNFLFRNNIVQINSVHIPDNRQHTEYPRDMTNIGAITSKYIEENHMQDFALSDGLQIT